MIDRLHVMMMVHWCAGVWCYINWLLLRRKVGVVCTLRWLACSVSLRWRPLQRCYLREY